MGVLCRQEENLANTRNSQLCPTPFFVRFSQHSHAQYGSETTRGREKRSQLRGRVSKLIGEHQATDESAPTNSTGFNSILFILCPPYSSKPPPDTLYQGSSACFPAVVNAIPGSRLLLDDYRLEDHLQVPALYMGWEDREKIEQEKKAA
ncbi:hypothetical protein GALMADRAFT_807444 [Galerina marginata CBS 339.88]|uniref:Uncharacterized protein n=1 Tax=Galerina marginata (strain CBS 339.88) TaxID=685588 RepID=A0A067SJP6_GALM3|nr:hypothetical protein GALMADRAFT_807444 [Galerina marginata CBS 339.88]